MTPAERAAREAGTDEIWLWVHSRECTCCGTTSGPATLDRCSKTNFPRGIVCDACLAILNASDDRVALARVLAYLARTQPFDPRHATPQPAQLTQG